MRTSSLERRWPLRLDRFLPGHSAFLVEGGRLGNSCLGHRLSRTEDAIVRPTGAMGHAVQSERN
jgi:hypothetical protein